MRAARMHRLWFANTSCGHWRDMGFRTPAILLMVLAAASTVVKAECPPGIYRSDSGAFVVLSGQRYLFRDGRRGTPGNESSLVACVDGKAVFDNVTGTRIATRETDATFESAATPLAGRLIEPPGPPDSQ